MLIRIIIGVIIIVAIILGAVLYNGYLDQSSIADSVSAKIQANNKVLSTVTDSNQGLQKEISGITAQINQAQSNLDLESKSIPPMTNSNVVVRNILTFGDKIGVSVIPLSTNDWTAIKINKIDYHVFRMSVEVKGPRQKIVDYVNQIQSSIDQYLVIESLNLTNLNLSAAVSSETPTSVPVISSFSPSSAYTGEYVVITGSNFIGATGVSFGGTAASFVINTDTQITAKVDIGTSGNVTVTNSIGTGALSGFSYLGATPLASPNPGTDTKANLNFAIYAK